MKRNIWVFVLGVATALVAMILFQLLQPLFQRDADLRAEIHPHRFVVPQGLLEEHAKKAVEDVLDLANDLGLAKDRSEPTDKTWKDLQEAIDTFSQIDGPLEHADGVVFIEISNEGEVPAKEVKLTIEGLRFYSLDPREGRDVTVTDKEVIGIPEISQDHTISIVAWTSNGSSYDIWSLASDQFGLAYADGRGDVSIYLPVRPFFSFLDARIGLIAWSALMIGPLLVAMFILYLQRPWRSEPTEDEATEETPERED